MRSRRDQSVAGLNGTEPRYVRVAATADATPAVEKIHAELTTAVSPVRRDWRQRRAGACRFTRRRV
jgi:hypothetical protein